MGGDEPLRLFLGLCIPDGWGRELAAWQARELAGGGRLVPLGNLHVTLAFLGTRPARELPAIVAALDAAVVRAERPRLEVARYRETRSAGMLVLGDEGGRATALATDVQTLLEELGVYRRESRPWLPHVTVVRYRRPPRLRPPLPSIGTLVPSDAAAYLSRLHPSGARYEVLRLCSLPEMRR